MTDTVPIGIDFRAKRRHSGRVTGTRWNHNIHYHRLILDAVPAATRTALDVGTGNGLLAAELHQNIPDVTAIDADADVLDSARGEDSEVEWILGDVLTYPFEPESFDAVVSVATLHHFPDLAQALSRLANLTAPGGVLAAVGLARSTRPSDFIRDVVGVVEHRRHKRRFDEWVHTAPIVWPPPHSYTEVRRTAAEVLPGVTWTRLAMWRYALVWNKPTVDSLPERSR